MKTLDGNEILLGKYGVVEIVSFYPVDRSGWCRNEVYRNHAGEAFNEGSHCLTKADVTEDQPRERYDARCGYCYLGAAHTSALHADRVAKA